MELVRGIRITDYCDQNNLPTVERLDLFMKVCQAIQHAHQKGIIHRDIKPSNILVTLLDGVPMPKVIDFGIAKAMDQRLTDKTLFTRFEQFIGTPAYMSPEQAELSGLDIDTRSDIYALGVLLYELLTGKTPFEAMRLLEAGLDEIRRIIREEEPPRPSTRLTSLTEEALSIVAKQRHSEAQKLIHGIRGDLDWIVMKALEKERNRRYETASGLAADLHRFLTNEPVTARPPSKLYRFQKMVRRNKLAFAAGAAVAAALVIGLGLSTWLFVAARTQAKRADRNAARAEVQRQAAEAAALEVKMTLSASDFFQGVRLIEEDHTHDALAYLARSLSTNPTNAAAITRLTTLLMYRSWMLPPAVMKHNNRVESAQFSPDGKRVVTASGNIARVWDAQSGQALTEPLKHNARVWSAQFSPDGKRVVTASTDKTARVWDVAPSETRFPDWLLPLTEAVSGQVLNKQNVLEETKLDLLDVVSRIRQTLNRDVDNTDWVVWGRWFLANRTTRTISPFAKTTVPQYIENRIQENTAESLDEAERVALGNQELLERIARARDSLSRRTVP